MSAILGIFAFDGRSEDESVVRRLLAAMSARGADRVDVWQGDGAAVAVSRYAWEVEPDFAGPTLITEAEDVVVAADASVYYRDELRRRLEAVGERPRGTTPGELILAAYRAWGARCAEEVMGDFAFIVWDRARRTVVCARDHSGARSLYYAELGDTLVVASTIGAVAEHPRCPTDLDLANVALDAAMIIFAYADTTCYRAVQSLPAGSTVTWTGAGPGHVARWWDPGVSGATRSLSAAAEELREILGDAVQQRVAEHDPTAIWLSGGWDSTAVFAAGRNRLGPRGERILPVSMSYPEGDSGREDEMIQRVADRWNARVRWVDGGAAPTIELSEAQARRRDEPFPYMFETFSRCLAQGARQTGARAVLTGNGGNYLFASSLSFLADLLTSLRWLRLWQEWRALRVPRGRRRRAFFSWVVQPALPDPLLLAVERFKGRRLYGTYERPVPYWLSGEFVRSHGIAERARAAVPETARGFSRSGYELHWFLTHPVFARLNSMAFASTLPAGIEQRWPLYDARVIRFAAAGPWSERYANAGTKRLLRQSMQGLLPEEVLADRFGRRDGTLATYVERSLRALWPYMAELLQRPVLAELGVVDPVRLKTEMDRYTSGSGHPFLPEQLLALAQAEAWFRAREGVPTSTPAAHAVPVPV